MSIKINKYSNYKPSNLNWLGNIPLHWILTKNRFGFKKIKNEYNNSDETKVLSLTTNGIKVKNDLTFGKTAISFIGHQLVKSGHIVFTPRDFDQTPILSDVSKFDGCISNLYIVDETKENLFNHYVNYFWYGLKFTVDYFKNFSHGMRYSFNRFQFDEIPLLIPPIKEQKLIVNYLNNKIEQINLSINKILKKIEILEEQQKLLIYNCVTKGLNRNVDMKDSKIECIGTIPKHWLVVRFKYLFTLVGGKDPKNIQCEDGKYPILGSGGEIDRGKKFLYNKKTLLLGRKGTVDRPFIFDGPFWVSDVMYYVVQKTQMTPDYLLYLFTIFPFKKYIYGSTQPSMSRLDYENHFFPVPPPQEQKKNLEYLVKKNISFKKILFSHKKKIELLKELEKVLISETVTGKVKVSEDII